MRNRTQVAPLRLFQRGYRWLRNSTHGPWPRLRRVIGVFVRAARGGQPIRTLPEAIAAAVLAPFPIPSKPQPVRPPRDWTPERLAAAARLRVFAGRDPAGPRRVAAIADDPRLDAYRSDWNVTAVRPEDWAEVLGREPPDLLVVEAARNGNHGSWAYRLAWTAHPDFFLQRDLSALTAWCSEQGIPTVFRALEPGDASTPAWSGAARLFDAIVPPDPEASRAFAAIVDRRGRVAPPVGPERGAADVIRAVLATG